MREYVIFTDSAADIPQHYYQTYEIHVVPMDYTLNGETFSFLTQSPDHDKICDGLYEAMRKGADVHTSQITPYRYVENWTEFLKAGKDILYVGFSSGMSATYENALSAAKDLMEEYPGSTVRVVDSLGGTGGLGILTVCACMNQEKGMSLEENASWLESKVPYLCHFFTVGDLDYLHKGGRVSASVALIGGVLKIKPMLSINEEGKLVMTAKSRGLSGAMKALVKTYEKEQGVEDVPRLVFVSHSSLYPEVEKIKAMIEEIALPGTVVETLCHTPISGVHTGPEFFAVCGFGFHKLATAN